MLTFDEQLQFHHRKICEAAGKEIPPDRLFPLVWSKDLLRRLQRSGVAMEIVNHDVEFWFPAINMAAGDKLPPYTFHRADERELFVAGSKLPANFCDQFFPHRERLTISNGEFGIDVTKDPERLFIGTETQLRFNDFFLAMIRDDKVHHGRGALLAPGMTLCRAPQHCAVAPLNEKTAVLIRRKTGDFALLLFEGFDGTTGITREQKEQQIPLAVGRISKNYGAAVADLTVDNVEVVPVRLIPDEQVKNRMVRVGIVSNGVSATEFYDCIVQYVEGVRGASLITPATLPDDVAGVRSSELGEGDRVFVGDVMSSQFERSTLLLPASGLRFARGFADPNSRGWTRHGAMMPGFAWRADQYMDVAPAPSISVWKNGQPLQMGFTEVKGADEYVMSQVSGTLRPTPSPDAPRA